jgi:16S rRNA G527 N7-methylase RsmG
MRVLLVEPVQKKCSFLNSVIGLLQLHDVSTFAGTIEQYTKRPINQVIDTIVLRALKYEEIIKYIPALLTPKGKLVLYRTEIIRKEEIEADFHLVSETAFLLPQGLGTRVITVMEKNV